MNEEVNTTQRQIQEQKVKFNGGGSSWISEAIKYGFLLLVLVVGIMVFLWVFGGQNGQYTDLGILFVAGAFTLWILYHTGAWFKYRSDKAELDRHFHDVSPILTVGDMYTHDFTPFYVPQFPEVQDNNEEYSTDDRTPEISQHAAPILTLSQQREKQILEYYDNGKTMNEIVAIMAHSSVFDAPSLHDVRKALGKTGKEKKENE